MTSNGQKVIIHNRQETTQPTIGKVDMEGSEASNSNQLIKHQELKSTDMKTDRERNKLQPVTADDLAQIMAIAKERSVGLEERCARYRRRAGMRRVAAAAFILAFFAFGAETALAIPPRYTVVDTSGSIDKGHACEIVYSILKMI